MQMKKYKKTNYHIQQRNQHLKKIYNESYYLELGVIDFKILEKIFQYEIVDIDDIIYHDLAFEGIGQILGQNEQEINLQLAYLDNLRNKSTSYKIFITMGVLKYRLLNSEEYYAPIVLIPVDLDLVNRKIVMSSEAITNSLIINDLKANLAIEISELPRNASIYDVHQFCEQLSKATNFSYTIDNYLTVVAVEYSDNLLNFDNLSVQRSIYEQTSYDVYQSYFSKIKAIYPSNIYQKWVLLKIDNGESFVVDGRLGSGKTYTIINAVADAISPNKHKKVLYISQDRNNIEEVYKQLANLHLSSYVYNLCNDEMILDEVSEEFDNIREDNIGIETIYPINEYEQALSSSIHRCRYSNIITELAYLKNTNPDITSIPIDSYLESNEIKNVYNDLKEIENALNLIEPLNVNVWRNIEPYYSKPHTSEIIQATKNYLKIAIDFNKLLKNYCNRFDLVFPKSFIDAQKLFHYISTFHKILPPLDCWIKRFDKQKITELLYSIDLYQKQYAELRKTIDDKVHHSYQTGTIEELMDIILYKHLTMEDFSYINYILSHNNEINDIINNIESSQKEIRKDIDYFKGEIRKEQLEEVDFEYLRKVYSLLSNNKIDPSWINIYTSGIFKLPAFQEISMHLVTYLNTKKYISSCLINEKSLNYHSLKQTVLNKDYSKHFISLFDRKIVRKNKISMDSLISSIFDLIDNGDNIKDMINQYGIKNNYKDLDTFIYHFDQWIDFINSLSVEENKIFQQHLLFNKTTISNSDNYLRVYKSFSNCEKTLNKQFQLLALLNIHIEGNHIEAKNNNALEWLDYLKRVVRVNNSLKQIFRSHPISYSDIIEILNCDKEYYSLMDILTTREKEMTEYLGSTYKGLDTDVALINTLMKHYFQFLAYLKNKNIINKLNKDNTIEVLVNEFIPLNDILEKELMAHNIFSKYFTNGQGELLELSFNDKIKRLVRYEEHLNELKYVFMIFDHCNYFEKLGLINLSEGILNSKYHQGISEQYIYSVYLEYKMELVNENPILLENNNILLWLQNYKYFEDNFCKTNLRELERNKPKIDKKLITHLKHIVFNDYNNIINELINTKSVFLSDISIFNSNLDLSKFDIIFVDDAHLASGFKYTHISKSKQVVMFGDSFSQNIRTNNIFTYLPIKNIFTLQESYCLDNPALGNIPSNYNQFILSFNKQENYKEFNDLQEIIEMIVKSFYLKQTKKIDIVISNNNYKFEVFKTIMKVLTLKENTVDALKFLDDNIRIVRAPYERARIVDEVYILLDNFNELEEKRIKNIITLYTTGSGSVYFCYTKACHIVQVKNYIKDLFDTKDLPTKQMPKLTALIYNELKSRGLNVEAGPGKIDLMIKGKTSKGKTIVPNVGIIIEGLVGKTSYAILDDYDYYYNEYSKKGWQMYIFCVSDIIDNLQEKLDVISSYLAGKDTKSVRQLKIDEFIKS